jgi:hypothetical protein
MVATVNASTSAGVVITPDNSGVLALQSSSTTALTIDASQNSTFVGTASATKLIPTGTSVTGNGLYLPAANSLGLSTNGTEAMRIDSSGNVGIGTTSPNIGGYGANSRILTIQGVSGSYAIAELSSNSANSDGTFVGRLDFSSSGQAANYVNVASIASILSGSTSTKFGSTLQFYTRADNAGSGSPSERMRIDSSGNLCVNSTSQVGAEKLGVKFNGAADNGIGVQTTASSSSDAFVIFRNSGGTLIGSITRVGTTNAVAYNTTSDERLKSNIADSQSVLDKLMDVKVRQYDWTEGDLHQDYGFIAQELEPTLSGVVTKGKTDEDMWQLDYSRLTPHLVKAIQEQQALITAQAETINALTARIVALESK